MKKNTKNDPPTAQAPTKGLRKTRRTSKHPNLNINNRTLLFLTALSQIPLILSNYHKPTHFPFSKIAKCRYHPAEPKPHRPTCIPTKRPSSPPSNCDWHSENICLECSGGHYLAFPDLECKPCTRGCLKCSGPGLSHCHQIAPGHRFSIGRWRIEGCVGEKEPQGKESCPNKPVKVRPKGEGGTRADSQDQQEDSEDKFVDAKERWETGGCEDCDNHHGLCKVCAHGYTGILVDGLEEDFVECKKCKKGCKRCNANGYCTECFAGRKLIRGVCLDTPFMKSQEFKNCRNFHHDGTRCIDCGKSEKRRWSHAYNKCIYCPSNCEVCQLPGKCLACSKGFRVNPTTQSCEKCLIPGCKNCHESSKVCLECLGGFYFDLSAKRCVKCHESCAECSGPNPGDCRACAFSHKKIFYQYEDVPSVLFQKMIQKMAEKYPGLAHMPMFIAKTFHTDHDTFCGRSCPHRADLERHQVMAGHGKRSNFTNNCWEIRGDHPHKVNNDNFDEIHFEFYESNSKKDEKEKRERVMGRRKREDVKRKVEEEMLEEGDGHRIEKHYKSRREYEEVVKKVKERDTRREEIERRKKELEDELNDIERDKSPEERYSGGGGRDGMYGYEETDGDI